MNINPLGLLIFILLIFAGCGRCGKDVNLGDFELIPQSIEDWFPYKEIDELTFKNAEGEIMTLQIEKREEEMLHQGHREICWESDFNNAVEFFLGEYTYANYTGTFDHIQYSISVSLQVTEIYYNDEKTDLRLQDVANYGFDISGDNGYLYGGIYLQVVNYRGNAIPTYNVVEIPPDFIEIIEINGNTYHDLWYFEREYAPAFYIQKGRGIIAFQGLNNELWELQ